MSPEQLAGAGVLPDVLPISSRLEHHFLRRVRSLPTETQTLLLVVAAESSGDSGLRWRAAAALGISADAADAAEEHDLLVAAPQVEFRHPLIRSAVYGGAAPAERRRVHAALAALIDGDREPDRQVWHRAAAAAGPDEEIALELERSRVRRRERGRYAEEAAQLTRAAELTPDPTHQAHRLLAAAQAHLVAGATHAAEALLAGRAAARRPAPERASRAPARRAAVVHHAERDPARPPLGRRGARGSRRAARTRHLRRSHRGMPGLVPADQGNVTARGRRAALAAPSPADRESTLTDLMVEGFARRLAVGYVESVPMLHEGIAVLANHTPDVTGFSRWAVLGNNAAADLWDADAYGAMLQRLEPTERERAARSTPCASRSVAWDTARCGPGASRWPRRITPRPARSARAGRRCRDLGVAESGALRLAR